VSAGEEPGAPPTGPASGAGEQAGQRDGKRRGRLLRTLSLVFAVLAGVFALLAALSALSGPPVVDGFRVPGQLPDGAKIVKAMGGPEAVDLVKSIHLEQEPVQVEKALIVTYSDGTVLWLAESPSDCSLVQAMAIKMNTTKAKLPYTPPVPARLDGTTVYMTMERFGDSLNAFWCRGRLVAWAKLGVPPSEEKLVAETLATLVRETSYQG
jgi:hypothetical protein